MIVRKTAADIEKMRAAGRVVAWVLDGLARAIVPEETRTADLDKLAARLVQEHGAKPAFLGYKGYPATTCISVNDEIVHGIPSERVLKNGDVVSLDFACSLRGYFADAAVTVGVGEISESAQRLLAVTRECLYVGIGEARVGGRIGDVAAAVQDYAESRGYGVVRELVGHGIGRSMHEAPDVPNVGRRGKLARIEDGTTFCIEPMINEGGADVEALSDGWTIVTADGKLSAHFEHTIAVTRRGVDILTLGDAADSLLSPPEMLEIGVLRRRALAAV